MNINSARTAQLIAEQFHEPLQTRLMERFEHALPPALARFAQLVWRRISSDEIDYFDVEHAVGTTLSCWHFANDAADLTPRISVHNPTFGRDGWETSHTVVQVLHPDMPFLTDSLLMELTRQQLTVHHLQNVVLHIERGADQRIGSFSERSNRPQTLIYIETDRIDDAKSDALASRLSAVLTDVRGAVGDFRNMKDQARRLAAQLRTEPEQAQTIDARGEKNLEAAAFLDWLMADHFTFLGYRSFLIDASSVRQEPHTSLGVFTARGPASDKRLDDLQHDARAFLLEAEPLSFSKSGTRSQVHRPAYPDYVMVKEINEHGQVVREHDFLGLYTTPVYSERPNNIPVVRRKIDAVLERSELDLNAFDGKNLVAAIASYPRDELFLCSEDELLHNAMGIVQIHERRRVKLFLRRDRYGLFYSCLVFVPRDRFNTQLRIAIQNLLSEALGALDVEFDSMFSESILVRTQFILRVDPTVSRNVDEAELEQQLIALTRDWSEDFHAALNTEFGELAARNYLQRYLAAFPTSYREQFSHRAAAYDVRHMARLSPERDLVMRFYREPQDDAHRVHLKLYHLGDVLPLSDVLPTLENLGLRVLDEHPYRVMPAGGETLSIQDFVLEYVAPLDLRQIGDNFEEAFVHIWDKAVDDDRYNRLVLGANLDCRAVNLLRAYGRYLKQVRFGFSQNFIADSLVKYPAIARGLVDYFHGRFSPNVGADAGVERDLLLGAMENVELLNEDRVLRRYLEMIDGTLRTNFFQVDENGQPKSYIALKFEPGKLSEMPKPVPAYEIFVFSRRTEGVHLRNGRIARGGLRWSDRLEDYRTEVLGLVKAQVVKNAVIVPTGAKGGFVLKHPPPGDREALQQEAIACYKIFISGLLDITDNYEGALIVPPPQVRRYDGDDPYLVVAADKGTATFSDIANELAQSRNFWLADAFASGGSVGYDHKKMAITARGAWVSVERHFSERGVDVSEDPVTIIGIGDMSGDVFGNGLLRSSSVKLLAAFNHLHIFIDPDPDPARSFNERQRLFDMPRSSWSDYDLALLSPGGAVYSRQQKSIALSAAARERFEISAESLSPDQLIHELLKSPIDLLWNGGIGTYVKGNKEAHADVGDRANDAIRVNAGDLRCRVFAEGGNLGMTQAARVEFALAGGGCNTDFIDNSAGVDCSDHEVNIKIALSLLTAAGELTYKQRNELLAEMSDDVAHLVLTNNFRQAQALALAERHAQTRLPEYSRLLNRMEAEQRMDRALEGLPSEDELAQRYARGQTLTRPELAVLLCYAKIHLKERLLGTGITADAEIAQLLHEEFPNKLIARTGALLAEHRLTEEIICTQTANDLVHHVGPSFMSHMKEFVGGDYADIVRGYFVAAGVFRVRELFRSIEQAAISEDKRLTLQLDIVRIGRRSTRWLLRHFRGRLDVAQLLGRFGEITEDLSRQPEIIEPMRMTRLLGFGVSEPLAKQLAGAEGAVDALPIIELCERINVPPATIAPVYARIGELLDTDWLVGQLNELSPDNHWQAMERDAIVDELLTHQGQICSRIVLQDGVANTTIEEVGAALQRFEAQRAPFVAAWREVISDARKGGGEFALYSMSARKLNELVRML